MCSETPLSIDVFVLKYTGCPKKKNAHRNLKMTVFTKSDFIFSDFSYFNLKFGIKQSKIG